MELAVALGIAQSGRVIMADIASVFTIGHVAQMLGEDDWLHDLSIDMFPEDGCLHVYGVGEGGDCLHPVRHRVPEANHRRQKSRRQRTAARQADAIAYPAVLTACLPYTVTFDLPLSAKTPWHLPKSGLHASRYE